MIIIIIKIKQQHRVKIMCNNGINEETSMQSTQEYSYLMFKVWWQVFAELLRTLCSMLKFTLLLSLPTTHCWPRLVF